jgi:hypothetical protein
MLIDVVGHIKVHRRDSYCRIFGFERHLSEKNHYITMHPNYCTSLNGPDTPHQLGGPPVGAQ